MSRLFLLCLFLGLAAAEVYFVDKFDGEGALGAIGWWRARGVRTFQSSRVAVVLS